MCAMRRLYAILNWGLLRPLPAKHAALQFLRMKKPPYQYQSFLFNYVVVIIFAANSRVGFNLTTSYERTSSAEDVSDSGGGDSGLTSGV